MTLQEWLGEDNQLAIDIWHKKYQYQNESFDEWLDRVSGNNEKVKQLIKEKKFLFGGRILSNRGLNKYGEKVTLRIVMLSLRLKILLKVFLNVPRNSLVHIVMAEVAELISVNLLQEGQKYIIQQKKLQALLVLWIYIALLQG